MLARLIESGMDVARINLSHGTTDEHAATIALLRRVAAERGVPLAILIDLPGPKLRTGDLPRPLTVKTGEVVTLGSSAAAQVAVNFPELLPHFSEGELILVDDGAVALRVTDVSPIAVDPGGVERRDHRVEEGREPARHAAAAPALTEADSDLLAWGLQSGHRLRGALLRARRRRHH